MEGLFIGQIVLNAGKIVPMGFLPCNGATLPIAGNQALYSLLGAKYGGNGKTNFAVPKLAGPEGTAYLIATQGIYPAS